MNSSFYSHKMSQIDGSMINLRMVVFLEEEDGVVLAVAACQLEAN